MGRGIRRVMAGGVCATVALLGGMTGTARATFHLWRIDEVYSNAGGSVQFIDFVQPSFTVDDERFLTEASLSDSSFGNSFAFPTDLPATPAANQHFLVATPGYAALSGVPTADYILPANDWFNPAGDTITYAGGVDSFTFTPGQLPTDGMDALFRAWGATAITSGPNVAMNFAGAGGAVAVPEPMSLLFMGAGGLALLRRRRCAVSKR